MNICWCSFSASLWQSLILRFMTESYDIERIIIPHIPPYSGHTQDITPLVLRYRRKAIGEPLPKIENKTVSRFPH